MENQGITDLLQKTESLGISDSILRFKPKKSEKENNHCEILVGKLLTEKKFNEGTMELTLSRNWRAIRQPAVTEIAQNTFVISFKTREDKLKIWESRPWKIADALLILLDRRDKGKIKLEELNFNRTLIWVQIHNFPGELRSEENIATPLNEIFKEIVRGDEMGVAEGRYVSFIRVLVEIDLSDPVSPGFYLQDDSPPDIWVEFKYERLPANFCYCCGRIGHSQLLCRYPEDKVEGRYGDWTRAGHHSPPSPLSISNKSTPGTGESKTGDNFTMEGDRSVGRLLDGRLAGGRGTQGRERKAVGCVKSKTPSHVGTTDTSAESPNESGGVPPGFGHPSPPNLVGQLYNMKKAMDCSPYIPRKLFPDSSDSDKGLGGNLHWLEQGQGSGARCGEANFVGPETESPLPAHFNPLMGHQGFYPSPNYLNMLQENMVSFQAHHPYMMWDKSQIEAQYLSPWGLRNEQPRKKIKASRKRKTRVSIQEQQEHNPLQNEGNGEGTDPRMDSAEVLVANQKPPGGP
ncbi:unnamed protein product [Linum trigynum]|uniref:CCHC-type domain-containing protein n=1 Tax=Linum trigynum TaxID=586398 RepID=A0AAV2DA57_9ROSI